MTLLARSQCDGCADFEAGRAARRSAGGRAQVSDETLAPIGTLLERAFVFDGRRLSLTFELTMPALDYPESTPHYE